MNRPAPAKVYLTRLLCYSVSLQPHLKSPVDRLSNKLQWFHPNIHTLRKVLKLSEFGFPPNSRLVCHVTRLKRIYTFLCS